jgi:tRNA(Ile)-lysidine synthase TilS/MesJ
VSGGVDSSYLLHMANKCGLKPLAVHLDNGFNSEIAVNNIEKITIHNTQGYLHGNFNFQ